MAKFILAAPSGLTLYLLIYNAAGQVWRVDTQVFEDQTLANLANYAVSLTAGDLANSYSADIPDLAAGVYGIQPMQQVDSEPSSLDEALAGRELQWDGTQEVTLASVAGNRVLTMPTAPPAAPYTADEVLAWLLAMMMFKRTQTATAQTLFQDDGVTPLAEAAVANDGVTTTRSEYSTP